MGRFKYSISRLKLWRFMTKLGAFFVGSIVLAVLYYILAASIFSTRQEKAMERENMLLASEYENLSAKVENLDKILDDLEARDRQIYGSILQGEPVNMNVREVSVSRYQDWAQDSCADLVSNTAASFKEIALRMDMITEDLVKITAAAASDSAELKDIPVRYPVDFPGIEAVGASMGMRIHPFYKVAVEHNGMDFLMGLGSDVYAPADGIVKKVSRSNRGPGNVVEISHKNGVYKTVYAHLGDILVRQGQKVTRGMVIARVGNSGMSFLPHLHYEVLLNGKNTDPVHYGFQDLSPGDYAKVLQTAYNTGQSLD